MCGRARSDAVFQGHIRGFVAYTIVAHTMVGQSGGTAILLGARTHQPPPFMRFTSLCHRCACIQFRKTLKNFLECHRVQGRDAEVDAFLEAFKATSPDHAAAVAGELPRNVAVEVLFELAANTQGRRVPLMIELKKLCRQNYVHPDAVVKSSAFLFAVQFCDLGALTVTPQLSNVGRCQCWVVVIMVVVVDYSAESQAVMVSLGCVTGANVGASSIVATSHQVGISFR
jgi:hypothetical protein